MATLIGIDVSSKDQQYYRRIVNEIVSYEEARVIFYYGLEKQGINQELSSKQYTYSTLTASKSPSHMQLSKSYECDG